MRFRMSGESLTRLALLHCYRHVYKNFEGVIDEFAKSNKKKRFYTIINLF